jgi:hypothetical protein
MQSLGDSAYNRLRKIAEDRDITVQELIRAIVIPDWLKMTERQNGGERQSERHRRRRTSRSNLKGSPLEMAVTPKTKRRP